MSSVVEVPQFNRTDSARFGTKSKNSIGQRIINKDKMLARSARMLNSGMAKHSKAFQTSSLARKGNMFAKQIELPHLPVPVLQQSLSKYQQAVRCLVEDNDFNKTKRIVEDFGKEGGIGEMLQERLIERSRVEVNWIAKWWDNSAYFDFRMPVVVHSSPGIAFPKQTFTDDLDQLRYAARAIRCTMNFKSLVDSESVPVDMLGPHPMCMMQYNNILSTCRVPHTQRDTRVKAGRGEDHHIIVMHNNNFYVMDVYRNGQPMPESELLSQLVEIRNSSQVREFPVGILTSDGRTQWANARQRLLKDSQNKSNLEKIEKSLFCLCLDESPLEHPSDQQESLGDPNYTVTSREMLHGGGTKSNSGNRWFDKVFQLVVGTDGHVGVCYEHSAAEGPPIVALSNHILGHAGNFRDIQPSPAGNLEAPVKLEWNMHPDNIEDINIAIERLDSLVDDVQLKSFIYRGYGKEMAKKNKMSPDAFIQLIMHLAYYRLHRQIPPTYESAATRKFQLGRTDTIRTASMTSKAFVEAMVASEKSKAELVHLFRTAVQAHTKYTKEACNGEAFDRHFFGLKMIAVESGMDLPEFFMDKTFKHALHFNMSTSQIGSKYDIVACFGPVVPDGYGICYNPQSNCVRYTVTAFNSNAQTDSVKMGEAVQRSFDEIGTLLTSAHL
ncbi:carnitine O-acetyltransferase-like [Dendronephthya gigantea]|uniref:carnitine O-acetyltransferase-like n=1 Tax=Dendronephthya gigantea TaxID=151771 RepID=UPI00106CCBA0|nr:carnitine O-acetyltransferase-like [Dendronephthya gigantea]